MKDPMKAARKIVREAKEKQVIGAEMAARIKAILSPEEIKAALASENRTQALLEAILAKQRGA